MKRCSFLSFLLRKHRLALGSSCLKQHDPLIDWSTGGGLSLSSYCLSTCLQSALPPAERAIVFEPSKPRTYELFPPFIMTPLTFSVRRRLFLSLLTYDFAIELPRVHHVLPDCRHHPLPWELILSLWLIKISPFGHALISMVLIILLLRTSTPAPPLIRSSFETLQGAAVFTRLDLRNGYNVVCIRKRDEWKTYVNTPLG